MRDPDDTQKPATGADFWSRRKAAVREAEEAERQQQDAAEVKKTVAALEEKTDAEILEELSLPDPDLMSEDDDFSRFLSASVPERLRRRALRRLWGLNPVLANLDGLCDYAEDYTDAATVVSDLKTVYQVGKGMFDRFAESTESEEPEEAVEALEETAQQITKPENDTQDKSLDSINSEVAAPQKDFVTNGNVLFPLTQRDEVGKAIAEELEAGGLPVAQDVDSQETEQKHRKRMRFDYS